MKHLVKVAAVAVIAVGVVAGCKSSDSDKPVSGSTTSPITGSTPKPTAQKPPEAPASTPKSDGRMVLLDRLSIPKMEGWVYPSDEEGKADGTPENDAFMDTQECPGASLEIPECPRVIVADEAAALKLAKEAGLKNPLAGMSRDEVAGYALCPPNSPSAKVAPRKPEGTDDIDGVIAYRYRATVKDCGVDVKTIPMIDPSFKGGRTLWVIQTNKLFISILVLDSGAKGMVRYADINKLRYSLTHGKWIG